MAKYVLSPQAQQSLKDIRAYSLETFGNQQTRRYLQQLKDRMNRLADQPNLGKQRGDIKAGYRSYPERSHTIYYRIRDTHIDIIDVLHQRMDPHRHL